MPNRLMLDDGPAGAMVRLNVRIPRRLKKEIAEVLGARGKNLNDWVRDALYEHLLREQAARPTSRSRTGRKSR